MKDIIDNPEEVETAVDFLYATSEYTLSLYTNSHMYMYLHTHTTHTHTHTAGVILHFKIPVIDNYYIIDPQRWFDLCALVISPDNVSSLVRNTGRPGGTCNMFSIVLHYSDCTSFA